MSTIFVAGLPAAPIGEGKVMEGMVMWPPLPHLRQQPPLPPLPPLCSLVLSPAWKWCFHGAGKVVAVWNRASVSPHHLLYRGGRAGGQVTWKGDS